MNNHDLLDFNQVMEEQLLVDEDLEQSNAKKFLNFFSELIIKYSNTSQTETNSEDVGA